MISNDLSKFDLSLILKSKFDPKRNVAAIEFYLRCLQEEIWSSGYKLGCS